MKPITLNAKSKKEFESILKDQHPILILYHMESCHYCKIFIPTWEDVKKHLGKSKTIHVVDVERLQLGMLPANLQNIAGFPHIQIVKNGHVVGEYRGDRGLDSVISFAEKYMPKKAKSATPQKHTPTKNKSLKAKKAKSV